MNTTAKRRGFPAFPYYRGLVTGIGALLEQSRRAVARTANCLMTATYWEVGRRIVEFEQGGKKRAENGDELIEKLAADLRGKFGRGFSRRNLQNMRQFYIAFPEDWIWQTLSAKSAGTIWQTTSAKSPGRKRAALPLISATSTTAPLDVEELVAAFPLPWSHYVLLISRARSAEAREFYHTESLRGGWSVRQLDRQISTLFYERTALSKNKLAMLKKGAKAKPGEVLSADEAIRDTLPNKVMAREYKLALPSAKGLEEEIRKTRRRLERRTQKREPPDGMNQG